MISSKHDRIRGTILGGALGDAVGLFTEFMSRREATSIYGPNPKFKLKPPVPEGFQGVHLDYHRTLFDRGDFTDDTDLSLLTLMSFLNKGGPTDAGIDALDYAQRLRNWVSYGFVPLGKLPVDIGNTIRTVANSPNYVNAPVEIAKSVWESGGKRNAANGAVMRIPIVGALLFNDEKRLYSSAINLASTTHADPRCLVSCTIMVGLIAALIRGEVHNDEDIRVIVQRGIDVLESHDTPLEKKHKDELNKLIWQDSLADLRLGDRMAMGYTYKCLASAVWALRQALELAGASKEQDLQNLGSLVYQKLITDITMAGGDSDTNAAVAGSALGAFFGHSNLHKPWLDDLRNADWLLSKADAAAYLILGEGDHYDPLSDMDTRIEAETR